MNAPVDKVLESINPDPGTDADDIEALYEPRSACLSCSGDGCSDCCFTGAASIEECYSCGGAGCEICNGDGLLDPIALAKSGDELQVKVQDHPSTCQCYPCLKLGNRRMALP